MPEFQLQVSLPSDREVMVTRQFAAPVGLLYRAYTSPDLLKRWLTGPPGWTMTVCEMDLRPGGKYRWRWRHDDNGLEFGFHGEYREVAPGAKIISTQIYDPGTVGGTMGEPAIITVLFAEDKGISTMTTIMDFGTKDSRDAAYSTGMTGGMEMGYQKLDRLLAG